MNHTIKQAPGFKPITLTITMETPAEALLLWATLGVATDAVLRKAAEDIKIPESRALVNTMIGSSIADGTYPIWDALDDALREAGLL